MIQKTKKKHVIFGDKPRNKSELKRETLYVLNLEKLINAAKYSDTDETKNPTKKGKKEILAYHYFKTRVKINNSFYNIRFATEELTINEIERYKKIGKLPPAEVSSEKSSLRTTWKSSPNNHSIANGKNLSSRIPKNCFLYQISDGRDKEYEMQYLKSRAVTATVDGQIENSNYVDLTEEYNKSYSENDIWENINKTAEKENIRTLNNEISIALINTSRKKEHIVFGDGFKNHPQIKRHKIYLMNLEKLINNAEYVGTENNQKPSHKNKKEVILYHYFETTVKIDERFYKVRFGTEELSEKETERYKNIGKLPPSTVSSKMSNLQTIWLSSPNEYSIAHGKTLSSTVPKQNYLYKIGERSLGRDYLKQIQNSQNKSPIKMDIRPMQNQMEENKMQKQNEQTQAQKAATNFVLDKLAQAGIEVITDKNEMREILNSGKLVQKMAAYHGTSREITDNESFSGYGTYVVSVSEDNAKRQGMKIASKKYGDTFYLKDQTLDQFLTEHNFSPYWSEMIKQDKFSNVDQLKTAVFFTNTKNNKELGKQQDELITLFKYNLIEFKREKTYLYSIDIPDNNGKNYLPYEKPIGIEQATKINDALSKLGTEWQVSRNDGGRQVYFDALSKVFPNNQEAASKFLKDCGFIGMEMNNSNYIIFDEKDININKRVQYMIDENGEVYGFTQNGKIYLDPDLMNSNTPVHEYTHIWDAYTQRTNPDLWQKGKDILSKTHLWNEVKNDPNYADIADDDNLVLSECHARVCGKIAAQVLERMAAQDGEIAKNAVIDWDKEMKDYVYEELYYELEALQYQREAFTPYGESFRLDAAEFFAQPIKDLCNERQIVQELENDEEIRMMARKNPEWLKTPLGNDSLLDKREWVCAHSHEFIEKYGDWEAKIKQDFLLSDNTVATLTGEEFQKSENKTLTEQVAEYFSNNNNLAKSAFFGDVKLDRKGADDSLAHGMTAIKAIAYAGVKDVIEKGVIIDSDYNHKGRGYDSYVVAAPIKIAEKNYICEVVLTKKNNDTRFYLHEVTEQKKFLDRAFVTHLAQRPAHQGTMISILENTFFVNHKITCVTVL